VRKRPQHPANIHMARTPHIKTKQVSHHSTGITFPGSSAMWPCWTYQNRLRTAMGLCKVNLVKLGYKNDGDVKCFCGGETNHDPSYFLSPTTSILDKCGPCRSIPNATLCMEHWYGRTWPWSDSRRSREDTR